MFSIPTPQTLIAKIAAGFIAAVIIFGAGSYTGYRFEHGALLELKLADQTAQTQAVALQGKSDAAQAKVNQTAAVAEAVAHQRVVTVIQTIVKEIPVHVTPAQDIRVAAACGISVGFYRELRAAESGITTDAVKLAPGQSDDDCADITASALADNLAQAIGAGTDNVQQLNALIAWINDNHQAQEVSP